MSMHWCKGGNRGRRAYAGIVTVSGQSLHSYQRRKKAVQSCGVRGLDGLLPPAALGGLRARLRAGLRLRLIALLIFLVLFRVEIARAAVTVTGASGGGALSADTAVNGGSGVWTTLGPITI